MESPMKILSEEHQNILKVIDALTKECDSIESGGNINKNFFEKTIDFIRNYADKFHHAKEEKILFVELCKEEVRMPCNPVEQMLYEHDSGRRFVTGLEEGLKENNRAKIIDNARGYIHLLQEHIYKEDNILYPMATQALSQQAQQSILRRFKEVENSQFNKGTKERLLSIVEELEKNNR